MRAMKVKEIFGNSDAKSVVYVEADSSVEEAIRLLNKHGIGVLLVRLQGVLEGIVSERDVIRLLANKGQSSLHDPIASIMTKDIRYCSQEDSIDAVLQQMTSNNFRHMPVRDSGDAVVAVISIKDVANAKITELELLKSQLIAFIQG